MDLDSLNLDRLATLMQLVKEQGCSEFTVGSISFKFPPPAEEVELPSTPTVTRATATKENPYTRLLGPDLPTFKPRS
jgi:hypothetical protein